MDAVETNNVTEMIRSRQKLELKSLPCPEVEFQFRQHCCSALYICIYIFICIYVYLYFIHHSVTLSTHCDALNLQKVALRQRPRCDSSAAASTDLIMAWREQCWGQTWRSLLQRQIHFYPIEPGLHIPQTCRTHRASLCWSPRIQADKHSL